MRPPEAKELIDSLSPREHEVCRRLVLGQSADVIAERINIGIRAVEIYRDRAKRKLKTTTHGIARIWYCALFCKETVNA